MASVIHLLVQTARMSDGSRKVTHIAEVTGMEDLNIKVRDIFVFEQSGVAEDGRILGEFRANKPSDEFLERLRLSGTPVPQELFDQVHTIL
jgi:pilus assembly protein CpaF